MGKKVLFVCLHRPDRSPSQRFRFEQYLDILRENGYDCRHVFLLNKSDDRHFYKGGSVLQKGGILLKSINRLINHAFFQKYDLVFVQREAFMLGSTFFERQFARRSKMIFDFDDSIWMKPMGGFKSKNRFFHFLKNPTKTQTLVRKADLVFAGNEYLANFAKGFNQEVVIVPTTIDTETYKVVPKPDKDRVCIGWSGSFSTIVHFQLMEGVLGRLKAKFGDKVYVKVIGDASYSNPDLGIQGLPWKMDTELEDLSEIDIGIMPLPDDAWANGKCALKGLQYMALGIPTVMSDVGVNGEVIDDGKNGFLAMPDDEWFDKLSRLIEDASLRQTLGAAGRKTVVDHYSVVANQSLYLKHFKELLASA